MGKTKVNEGFEPRSTEVKGRLNLVASTFVLNQLTQLSQTSIKVSLIFLNKVQHYFVGFFVYCLSHIQQLNMRDQFKDHFLEDKKYLTHNVLEGMKVANMDLIPTIVL